MIGSTPRKWRSDGSPVNGDVHAGFCGGPGGEIPPGYPTGGVTRRAIPRNVKSEACGPLSRLLTAVVAGEGLPVTVGRLSPYRQGHAHERLCFAMSWVG